MKSEIYILDASAIINASFLPEGKLLTTELVRNEIKDHESKLLLESGQIKIFEPSKDSLETIKELIKEHKLKLSLFSEADISVLALALEFAKKEEVTIVTDDYDIQSLCSKIEINYRPVIFEGIR